MTTKSKRSVFWVDTIDQVNILAASGQQTVDLLPVESGAARKGQTITRLILKLVIEPSVADISYRPTWGVVLVNSDALTAGAVPESNDEDDQPGWLLRDVGIAETHDVNDGSNFLRMEYDLASQRRFYNQQNRLIFEISQGASGQSLVWHLFARVLVKDV